ncbi:hypothetical protein LSAT2_024801 [Lamellibrachia satsuma]|nr:hypothetical protein LSAT2_024801 [Lamellibrachia satsuma]
MIADRRYDVTVFKCLHHTIVGVFSQEAIRTFTASAVKSADIGKRGDRVAGCIKLFQQRDVFHHPPSLLWIVSLSKYVGAFEVPLDQPVFVVPFLVFVYSRHPIAYNRHPIAYNRHLVAHNNHLIAYRRHLIAHSSHLIAHSSHLIAYNRHLIAHNSHLIAYSRHADLSRLEVANIQCSPATQTHVPSTEIEMTLERTYPRHPGLGTTPKFSSNRRNGAGKSTPHGWDLSSQKLLLDLVFSNGNK